MVTAGASQALHMITTVMFSKDSIVFVEEPTYFAASMMLSVDLQMKVIPGMTSGGKKFHKIQGNVRLPFKIARRFLDPQIELFFFIFRALSTICRKSTQVLILS